MAAEPRALVGELAVVTEREHLKTAAVGENRLVPAVELVEAAGFLDDIGAGTQVEMVCVAKDNLSLDIVTQFMRVDTLDRAKGAYRHKYRSLDLTVVGRDHTGTRIAAGRYSF